MAKHVVNELDYATPLPLRAADPSLMFGYLFPGAICIAAFLGSWLIEADFPGQDSRNLGPACSLFMVPFALVFGIVAIRDAYRPNGRRALLWGLAWNIPVASGPALILWVVVHFGLLKHAL